MSEYKRGDFSRDDPRYELPELSAVFDRPPYAPTPINPYDLKKDGVGYIQSAQSIVRELFTRNLARLDERPSGAVIELLETSVMSALFRRFDNNGGKLLPHDCDDESAELFIKACLGQASPDDLITLLGRRPEDLDSIELAKQTHPFDWGATMEMDVEIDTMLDRQHFEKRGGERTQNVRYYFMRTDDYEQPAAAMFVRKADVGVKQTDRNGAIFVVQRDSFVVDLQRDETKVHKDEVSRWLAVARKEGWKRNAQKTPYSGEAVTEFLNSQLATRIDLRSPAIYPGVRSYYAFYESKTSDDADMMDDA